MGSDNEPWRGHSGYWGSNGGYSVVNAWGQGGTAHRTDGALGESACDCLRPHAPACTCLRARLRIACLHLPATACTLACACMRLPACPHKHGMHHHFMNITNCHQTCIGRRVAKMSFGTDLNSQTAPRQSCVIASKSPTHTQT